MHLLVGLLSGPQALWRLLGLQCLHELSQSHQPNVTLACVPATPYLLTYLSGQSTKLTVSGQVHQTQNNTVLEL